MRHSRTLCSAIAILACVCASAHGDHRWLMVPVNSTSNDNDFRRIMLMDITDGSIIDQDWIDGTGLFGFSPAVLQVGEQIWVSDSISNTLYRFDIDFSTSPPTASLVGSISDPAIENPRGMEFFEGHVYLASSAFQGLVKLDMEGNVLGQTGAFEINILDVAAINGELLVSDFNGDDILRYDTDLNLLGVFHDSDSVTGIDAPQQIKQRNSIGTVLVGGFETPSGLYEYDDSGTEINHLLLNPIRGVHELVNGDILLSASMKLILMDGVTYATEEIFQQGDISYRAAQIDVLEVPDDSPAHPGTCPLDETQKLVATNPQVDAIFGSALTSSGNLTLAGAVLEDAPLTNSGAAYVHRFEKGIWQFDARLTPEVTEVSLGFGNAAAIDASVGLAAIGAVGADTPSHPDKGAVYIFSREGPSAWSEDAKITLSPEDMELQEDALIPSGLGLGISGDTVLIGSRKYSPGGIFAGFFAAGASWVFRLENGVWEQEAILTASDKAENDRFGVSVDLDGTMAVIGADRVDDVADNAGAIYVFKRIGAHQWVEDAKITVPELNEDAHFGQSVAISGGTIVVGAPQYTSDLGQLTGGAWVFTKIGMNWAIQGELLAFDTVSLDNFGWSVDIDGDWIVVGAEHADAVINGEVVPNSGAAYVFKRVHSEWVQWRKLQASDGNINDLMGRNVSVAGTKALIGAEFHDAQMGNDGAVFTFELDQPDCNGNGAPDDCDIEAGISLDVNGDGIPDECGPDPCPWDLDDSGLVGTSDLLELFSQWGTEGTADFDESGAVGTADLLILFANWGPCP